MIKLNTDVNSFTSFLKAIQLKGIVNTAFNECSIDVKNGGLVVAMVDKSHTICQILKWKSEDSENEYIKILDGAGNFIISDISKVLKLLSVFKPGDTLNISINENKILFKSTDTKKQVSTTIGSNYGIESISQDMFVYDLINNPQIRGEELSKNIIVKGEDVLNVISNIKNLDNKKVTFDISNEFTIKLGDSDSSIEETIPCEINIGADNLKVSYIANISNIFNNVIGDVKIFFKEDGSMWVNCISGSIRKDYILASVNDEE